MGIAAEDAKAYIKVLLKESDSSKAADILRKYKVAKPDASAGGPSTGAAARAGTELVDEANVILRKTVDVLLSGKDIDLKDLSKLSECAEENAGLLQRCLKELGIADDQIQVVIQALRDKDLIKIADVFESIKSLKLAEKIGVLVRFGRLVGPAVAALGVGANALAAIQEYWNSTKIKNNPQLKKEFEDCASFLAGMTIADGGLLVAGVGAKFAIPLTVLFEGAKYIVISASDAAKEMYMSTDEYLGLIEKHGSEEVIHRWFTTGNDLALSEVYFSSYFRALESDIQYQRYRTRLKIVEALIFSETADKSKEYNLYRLRFIESYAFELMISDFNSGKRLLEQSKFFAEFMTDRKKVFNGPGVYPEMIHLEELRYVSYTIS
jgi:hypothetical protein